MKWECGSRSQTVHVSSSGRSILRQAKVARSRLSACAARDRRRSLKPQKRKPPRLAAYTNTTEPLWVILVCCMCVSSYLQPEDSINKLSTYLLNVAVASADVAQHFAIIPEIRLLLC